MTIKPDPSADLEFINHAKSAPHGILRELWDLIRFNKKWWLTPIIVVLLLLGVLIMISGTVAAPFIYTLF